jgi:hypothetical protein
VVARPERERRDGRVEPVTLLHGGTSEYVLRGTSGYPTAASSPSRS